MFRRLDAMLQTWLDPLLRKWFAGSRPHHARREMTIVHDPAAARAHDLDDPFFDPMVQRRVGFLIGNAMLHAPRPSDRSANRVHPT